MLGNRPPHKFEVNYIFQNDPRAQIIEADEDLPVRGGDPRVAAALKEPLVHEAEKVRGLAVAGIEIPAGHALDRGGEKLPCLFILAAREVPGTERCRGAGVGLDWRSQRSPPGTAWSSRPAAPGWGRAT